MSRSSRWSTRRSRHDDPIADVAAGWPFIIAGLKTLLETGEPLTGRLTPGPSIAIDDTYTHTRKDGMKDTKSSARTSDGFTAEERKAMQERARELKAASSKADGREATCSRRSPRCRSQIASLAERVHAIVMAASPDLSPKTWYGMPAYARDSKDICFFQAASKFKVRYATFGLQPAAKVDDGSMWPIAYALTELTAADEARIAALVKKAVGSD